MVVALGCVDAVECKMIVQFSSVLMTGGGRLKHSQWLHFELSNVSDIALILLSKKNNQKPLALLFSLLFFLALTLFCPFDIYSDGEEFTHGRVCEREIKTERDPGAAVCLKKKRLQAFISVFCLNLF